MSLMVFMGARLGRFPDGNDMISRGTAIMSLHYFTQALAMMKLDSLLLDMHTPEDDIPFSKALVRIGLHSFADDNECESKTRFTKHQIRMMIHSLSLPKIFYLRYNPRNYNAYYKFDSEELFIYMLRKMSTGSTHKNLADVEFGGCSGRWGRGYAFLVKLLDRKWYRAIGPAGLRFWAPEFPAFAETIRSFIHRRKPRVDNEGNITYRAMTETYIPPGEFNIFSFTDCTVYEVCRPGSGPNKNGEPAARKEGWYVRQRAFYDGYHRGMEACVKILTILLPNGLTGAVYGPTSGREDDRRLFSLSELDDYLMELCQQHHGDGSLYCTYGDGIFAGRWFCLRTRHEAAPQTELTLAQRQEQNENMKSARESIEHSYSKAETLWPLLVWKDDKKIELDPARLFAEIRVMYMLTNMKICALEGSTMTGERMFACPPPTLKEYLQKISHEDE